MDKYIDCIALTAEVWDSSNIVVFLNVIRDIVDKKNNGGQLYVLSECCHGYFFFFFFFFCYLGFNGQLSLFLSFFATSIIKLR